MDETLIRKLYFTKISWTAWTLHHQAASGISGSGLDQGTNVLCIHWQAPFQLESIPAPRQQIHRACIYDYGYWLGTTGDMVSDFIVFSVRVLIPIGIVRLWLLGCLQLVVRQLPYIYF